MVSQLSTERAAVPAVLREAVEAPTADRVAVAIVVEALEVDQAAAVVAVEDPEVGQAAAMVENLEVGAATVSDQPSPHLLRVACRYKRWLAPPLVYGSACELLSDDRSSSFLR